MRDWRQLRGLFHTPGWDTLEDTYFSVAALEILGGLDRMNMYRIAAFKLPFAMPVKDRFRWTSGFGYRRDPKGAGNRKGRG